MPDYPCDLCGHGPADFMVTLTRNGDTLSLGVECVAAWAEAIVTALDEAAARDTSAPPPAAPEPPAPPAMTVVAASDGPDRAQEAAGDPDDQWGAGYPQGRPAGPAEADPGREAAVGSDTSPAPAADE